MMMGAAGVGNVEEGERRGHMVTTVSKIYGATCT